MKNDIKINILNHEKVEIIDDEEFIQKLRNSKKLEEYVTLELMRTGELQEIIQNEKIYKYNENKFDYIKSMKAINEKGQIENYHIIHGQIFTINYEDNTLNIIDKKIYEGHFERINEYKYCLKNVGIVDNKIKVILNYINRIRQKNDCEFLLYILANRKNIIKKEEKNTKIGDEIDNLFKLWNITEKYYSYKQYKIYLNLYEELYMDYLKNNSDINLLKYENIKMQMKKIRKEILEGD